MNTIVKSLKILQDNDRVLLPASTVAVLLLSANAAKGNDGRYCPLFHGSLAPMLFGETEDIELQELLVCSNTITWTKGVAFYPPCIFPVNDEKRFKNVFTKLLSTKYFAQNVREIVIFSEDDELIKYCITSCRSLEKISIGKASISIREMFSHLTRSLKSLVFYGNRRISHFDTLVNFKQRESLSFRFIDFTNEDFQHLRFLYKLRTLSIFGRNEFTLQNSRNVFEQLSPSLRELQLTVSSPICDVSGIGELVNLELLAITCFQDIVVSGFEEWKYFPRLCSLSLRVSNPSVEFPSFKHLSPLPNLRELSVELEYHSIDKITDLIEISPNITKIALSAPAISKQVMDTVGTKLQFLGELKITNAGRAQTSQAILPWNGPISETLRKVHVSQINSLDFLSPCKKVEDLQLTRSGVKDLALFPKSFGKLRSLEINESSGNAAALQKLFDPENKFEVLEELSINIISFNDAVLQKIAESCPTLRRLTLSDLRFFQPTKRSLEAIEIMKNVEVFRVQKGYLKQPDLLELKMKRPDMKIVLLNANGEDDKEITLKSDNESGNRRHRE